MLVVPHQVQLARADHAFDAEGRLADAAASKQLGNLARQLVEVAGKLAR